jgi:murein L,D-transpeptidase YafK
LVVASDAIVLLFATLMALAEPARVGAARADKLPMVKAMFAAAGVAYPPRQLLLRSFKTEAVLELWAGDAKELVLVKSYAVCARSGTLGPKREEGDLQVPEGFYTIDSLNPWSDFHLSLHVDYPNAADRARSTKAGVKHFGGAIMVHGNCVTIGCIPLRDEPIEEVFLIVNDAKARGTKIPIHILPRRLDDAALAELLAGDAPDDAKALWRTLAEGQRAFESTHRVPRVSVDHAGRYVIVPSRY